MFRRVKSFVAALCLAAVCVVPIPTATASGASPDQISARLADQVRHELLMLPYYGVFDWLEAELRPDDTVVLHGQVLEPTTRSAAEARVRKLESAANVVNRIEVLPLSQNDDRIRRQVYSAMFSSVDSPLLKYAVGSASPIHIIVRNGRITLKGLVASQMDSQMAYMAARGVPGSFEVRNELVVEKS
jgi:hyperosmotically inducible protein